VEHTGFGVIQGEDRKKYKTRSGETVRLVDVLDEAKDRAKAALLERQAAGSSGVAAGDGAELERAAAVLGYGGMKYFDLRQQRTSDYVFNYDRMLSPDGDTAVYLEYAHARLCSISRKAADAGVDVRAVLAAAPAGTRFTHPTETALITELTRFPGVMRRATATLMPHVLCEFVYALANRTAEFHRDCNVLGAATPPDVRDSRLRMVAAAQAVIAQTLALLGITALERF
jgi:arginyl-tRNA synthetase